MAPPSAWKTGTTIAGVVFKVIVPHAHMQHTACTHATSSARDRWQRSVLPPLTLAATPTAISSACSPHPHPELPPTSLTVLKSYFSVVPLGWRRARRRHAVDVWLHSGRQKLREDPLHRPQHLLLRRWHGGGHYERHGHDQQQPGAAPLRDGPAIAGRHCHDYAQVAPVPVRGMRGRGQRRRQLAGCSCRCMV